MSNPIWIDCPSVADAPPPEMLLAQARDGRHVVLTFRAIAAGDKRALVDSLSRALPSHSIFDSGGDGRGRQWVTVMPVVSRERVLASRRDIIRAIRAYRRTCLALVEAYRSGSLSEDWAADEHGEHCRFENTRTGEIVEAPLDESGEPLDPYFFAEFVKSTPEMAGVASLIASDFHDAVRILEVVGRRRRTSGCS